MTATKALTLRLPERLAEDLATVAMVDGEPMADTIRTAITAYIDRRTGAPDWPERTRAMVDRLNRLAEGGQHA